MGVADMLPRLLPQMFPGAVPEHKFHPIRKWKFDWAWPDRFIAMEIEGGIWRKGGGAHSRPANIIRDIEKYNEAALAGWTVLRVTHDMLRNGEAFNLVERAYLSRYSTPA